jgi:ABC-type lipoprotein release transport system permease subunit
MKMIYTIAWRNVWRSKLRSSVVIISIALGIWGGLSYLALSFGLNDQRTRSVIESTLSHIQIHDPDFVKDRNPIYVIDDWEGVMTSIQKDTNVIAMTYRAEITGMISSAAGGAGVSIHGIDRSMEPQVTDLHSKLLEGDYLENNKRNQILISAKIAEKLNLRMRSKVVLTFQDSESNIQTGLFRVGGIYKTNNSMYDEANVFVKVEDIWRLLGSPAVHEIAVIVNDIDRVGPIKENWRGEYTDLLVEDWTDLAPELAYADEMMSTFLYIFIGILMLALSFGIVNTMLMAILERKQELGMLMAVGMNKRRVFWMILLETLYIGLAGGPLGILFSWLTIGYYAQYGLDLSFYAQGLEKVGIDTVVYPYLEPSAYAVVGVMVVITAILSAISPARRALKLNPTEAIRSI